MANKKSARTKNVSNGERPNVSKQTRKLMRQERNADLLGKEIRRMNAFRAGKKVKETETIKFMKRRSGHFQIRDAVTDKTVAPVVQL